VRGLIIGSTAIRNWFSEFPRESKDLDLWSPDTRDDLQAMFPDRKIDVFWDDRLNKIIPEWANLYNQDRGNMAYAFPDELYTMKVSHSSWELPNGTWNKHMWDVLWLKSRGAKLIPEMWELLYPIWSDVHGKKKVNLNQESGAFFTDAVVRIYDHDSIHDTVAHYDRPLWMEVLKDGQDVAMDMKKVWALSWADQIKMFREEIYATALERWMIPSDYRFSPARAYFLALKKTITSLTKGVSSRFIIDNFDVFKHMPLDCHGEAWYMRSHRENRGLLKPLEK